MQAIDYDYIGTITGNLFGVPIRIYKTIHLFFTIPQLHLLKIPFLYISQTS